MAEERNAANDEVSNRQASDDGEQLTDTVRPLTAAFQGARQLMAYSPVMIGDPMRDRMASSTRYGPFLGLDVRVIVLTNISCLRLVMATKWATRRM